MKSLRDFITVAEFLGNDMTRDQATRIVDEAKQQLSQNDISKLSNYVGGHLYTDISEYNAECGRF
jgi:hypothetical protein